jgi:hypothetical protein
MISSNRIRMPPSGDGEGEDEDEGDDWANETRY